LPKVASFYTASNSSHNFTFNLKDLPEGTKYSFHLNPADNFIFSSHPLSEFTIGVYDTSQLFQKLVSTDGKNIEFKFYNYKEIQASDFQQLSGSNVISSEPTKLISGNLSLKPSDLSSLVEQAESRWLSLLSDHGVDLDQAKVRLDATTISLDNLDFGILATTKSNHIVIDSDAAGYGWFIDPTPSDDLEFNINPNTGILTAISGSKAHGQFDLLTAIMHEFGHILGYSLEDSNGSVTNHSYSQAALMGARLSPSLRLDPTVDDADHLFTLVTSGDLLADQGTDSILLNGLQSFGEWAGSLSLGDMTGIPIPFVKEGIDSLWGSSGIADAI